LRLNEHMEEDGPLVFHHACKLGLEGIVSKHRAGCSFRVPPLRKAVPATFSRYSIKPTFPSSSPTTPARQCGLSHPCCSEVATPPTAYPDDLDERIIGGDEGPPGWKTLSEVRQISLVACNCLDAGEGADCVAARDGTAFTAVAPMERPVSAHCPRM
jgi:hypothetical protein